MSSYFNIATSKCPDGTYEVPAPIRGKWNCLLFNINDGEVFIDAETICKQKNGHLISIQNGFLNQYIAELGHAMYGQGVFWIGVTNMVGEVWRNVDDGTNITFSNWASGYPTSNSDESCVAIGDNGLWYNYICDGWHPLFFCGVPGDGNETKIGSVIRP